MISIHRRAAGLVTFAFVGIALIACSAGGEGAGSTSSAFSGYGWGQGGGFDPLLMGSDGGFGGACATCIESSCSPQLSALEGELKALHSATHAAFGCVQANKCLSLFWEAGDAGKAAAKEAVLACIAACDAEAGLLDVDAAEGELAGLTEALQSCVESSCAASCPFANQDAGAAKPPPPTNDDGGSVSEDAGAVSEDAGQVSEDAGAVSEDAGQVSEDSGSGNGYGGWGGAGSSGLGNGCH